MKTTSGQYAKALYGALKETPSDRQGELIDNFVKLLIKDNALRQFDEVLARFEEYEMKERGAAEVGVVTADPLGEELRRKIIGKMERLTGKKIVLKEKTDVGILGGIIIRFNDYLFDASVLAKIKRLGKDLVS